MSTNIWIIAATSWTMFIFFSVNASSYLNKHTPCRTLPDRNATRQDSPDRRTGNLTSTFTDDTLLSIVFLSIALVSSLAAVNL